MKNLVQFREWRKQFLRPDAPDSEAYECVLEIIDRTTHIADFYRSDPDALDVEEEIGDRLYLFRGLAHERNLRLLRRFFLRRYALCRVCEIDRILIDRCKASRPWLFKDYAMPRVGLAQILGLGVILGASGVFSGLQDIANGPHWWFRIVVLVSSLALVRGLIYLHVRDRIGGPAKRLKTRVWILFAISMVWPALAMFLEWVAGKAVGWTFCAWRAILVNAAALLFALLSQFFFSKDATIADPL